MISRARSFSVLGALAIGSLASLASAPVASAQATVQGQIIIQEQTPTTTVAPPPSTPAPQAQIYAPVPQQEVYVQPTVAAAPQCPVGSVPSTDRWGRPGCFVETTQHGISGGLLGGGIGLLAGGWVASWFSGLVVVTFGAVGCAFSAGCDWITTGHADAFFNWGWVPVLGPWVQMGYTWPNANEGIYAWLAIEGLLQAGGLTMLIFGAIGEDRVVMEPVPGYAITIEPMISGSAQGMSARMTF